MGRIAVADNMGCNLTLMEFFVLTVTIFLVMTLVTSLCCVCMKIRDRQLKRHVLDLAKSKGIKLDPDKLERKKPVCQSPHASENCTIIIPDVAIIL